MPGMGGAVEGQMETEVEGVEKVGQGAVTYRADFEYMRWSDGVMVVEDVKICPALVPKEYVLKEKLFRWRFGFPIRRVYNAAENV